MIKSSIAGTRLVGRMCVGENFVNSFAVALLNLGTREQKGLLLQALLLIKVIYFKSMLEYI